LLVAAAIVAAELVRHKKRLPSLLRVLIYTYSEFVLLGLAIGPRGLQLIGTDLLDQLDPFLHLSLGGVGLIFGLQFNATQLKRFPLAMFGLAFFQAAFTFLLCGLAFFWVAIALGFSMGGAVFLAAVLATIASVSAPQIIAHLIHEQQARGKNAHLLQFITSVDGAFGVLVLALLLGAHSEYWLTPWRGLNALLWLVFSAAIGVACGLVFHWLIQVRTSTQEMVLYLLGLVTLSSGVAATLHLSPLFVNVVFGLTVANLSLRVEEIFRQMGRLEHPLFIVLLILAGARWQLSGGWVVPLVLAYLGFRFLGKWLGCLVGREYFRLYFKPVDRLGMALLSQGGLALALLITLTLAESGRLVALIETAVIVSIIASELLAPPLVRHVLARGREWRPAP